jgi:hypothetical protein
MWSGQHVFRAALGEALLGLIAASKKQLHRCNKLTSSLLFN